MTPIKHTTIKRKYPKQDEIYANKILLGKKAIQDEFNKVYHISSENEQDEKVSALHDSLWRFGLILSMANSYIVYASNFDMEKAVKLLSKVQGPIGEEPMRNVATDFVWAMDEKIKMGIVLADIFFITNKDVEKWVENYQPTVNDEEVEDE
jgi:hypothetical protein